MFLLVGWEVNLLFQILSCPAESLVKCIDINCLWATQHETKNPFKVVENSINNIVLPILSNVNCQQYCLTWVT